MTSKYNNFGLDSNPIEIDIKQGGGEPNIISKKRGGRKSSPLKGRLSPVSSDAKDGDTNQNSMTFSRVKAQNMTGFTNDSIVTGALLEGNSKTPLANRKMMTTTMFPDISAVEQFYAQNN